MSNPEQIEKELRDYLEKEPNLRREDRIEYLRTIFDKHFSLNKIDHMVNRGDLYEIFSVAGNRYATQKMPVSITRKELDTAEVRNLVVMEAFIGYLNRMNLLVKNIKFDYTS